MNKPLIILKYSAAVTLAALIILISVFIPEKWSDLSNNTILDTVKTEDADESPESLHYSLTTPERLYIVSMALNNRNILQSDYAASLREKAIRTNGDDSAASFAYVKNGRGPAQGEIDAGEAMLSCNRELSAIVEEILGITGYSANNPCRQTLFSAVDMLDPQKNVSVWQIEYDSTLPPAGSDFSLMEAYVDAETGKVYSFAFRMNHSMDFNADKLAKAWLGRLSITDMGDLTENTPLTDAGKQYKRYATDGMDQKKTVFFAGYYAGINEVFVNCY